MSSSIVLLRALCWVYILVFSLVLLSGDALSVKEQNDVPYAPVEGTDVEVQCPVQSGFEVVDIGVEKFRKECQNVCGHVFVRFASGDPEDKLDSHSTVQMLWEENGNCAFSPLQSICGQDRICECEFPALLLLPTRRGMMHLSALVPCNGFLLDAS